MAIFSCLQSNFLFFSTFKTKSLVFEDFRLSFLNIIATLWDLGGDFYDQDAPLFILSALFIDRGATFKKIKVHFLKSISHSIFSFRGSLFITPRSAPYKKLKKIKISASTSFLNFRGALHFSSVHLKISTTPFIKNKKI